MQFRRELVAAYVTFQDYRTFVALVWLVSLYLVVATNAAPAHAQESEYTLGTGDSLRVTVFGHTDLSGDFQVGASGYVAMPLIGEIAARGRTARELEAAIVGALKPDYLKNPRVGVEVTNYRPFYIIGEVKAPGSYAYVSGMRVVNAVALAGGFTYRARENSLFITRATTGTNEKEPADQNTVVLPGDIIEVPERFF